MLQIKGLNKSFVDGQRTVTPIVDLSLEVLQGQSIAITGDSGTGKSTLLHLIASLDQADSGDIIVDGQHITQFNEKQADSYRQRDIGLVFQQYNLINCLSLWDNVCLPARLNQRFDEGLVTNLLAQLGLTEQRNQLPQNLSGGEQQRAAIARAIVHKPKLILADEPTGNLDDKNSAGVSELLFEMCRQHNTTLVLVTHSQSLAQRADKHFHLESGKLTHVAS